MDKNEFKKGMKEIRKPLQKAVGHTRRERHNKAIANSKAIHNKIN